MSYNPANNFLTSSSSLTSEPKAARKEWTQPEIEYVLKYKNTKSHKELADVLGRTTTAVAQKLWKLTQLAQSQSTNTTVHQPNQMLTGKASDTDFTDNSSDSDGTESETDEDDDVDEDEQKQTVEEPAQSAKQPKPKRKYKPWTDEHVQTLMTLSTSKSFDEIAKIMDRSKSSVEAKYRKLKQQQQDDDTIRCGAAGCNRVFETEKSLKTHIAKTRDTAHQKYRAQRKVIKEEEKKKKKNDQEEQKVDVKPEIDDKSKEKKKKKKHKKKDKKSEKKKRKKQKQKSAETESEPAMSPISQSRTKTTFSAGDSTINITFNSALPSVSTDTLPAVSPRAASQDNSPSPPAIISSILRASIFSDKTFALCGRLSMKQSEIEAVIIRNGGKIDKSPTTETDFVVVKNAETNINNSVCQNAMCVLKIPFVIEQFIHDSIAAKKMLQALDYRYMVKKEESEQKLKEQPLAKFSSDDDDDDIMKDMPIMANAEGVAFSVKNPLKRTLKAEDDEDSKGPQRKRAKVDKLKWTVDDVASWIAGLNVKYEDYVPKFKEEKVSGELMDHLDDDSLACIVKNPLHRKKILLKWKKL